MKSIFTILLFFSLGFAIAQPANDNCASATTLTVGNPLLCNQVIGPATAQSGECLANWAGAGNATVWYRFTATNDSLVLNCIATAGSGYFIRIFGPAPSCQPSCASAIYSQQQTGDPGEHILITPLTPGQVYFIQIDAADPNGPSETALVLCINLNSPAAAGLSTGALQLNACGTSFSNSTNGGFWQSGTGTSFANFDGDATDEMPFIGNNTSWSYFCSLVPGTWQVTVSGISGCTLPAPNQGVQASLMTGTTSSLTNYANSQNPIPPGGSWTSPSVTVNAGQCAYIAVDGFAGDACNYTVTLTNLTGGCVILPIELLSFGANDMGDYVSLKWTTASEVNNDYFVVERSSDGENFSLVSVVDGAEFSSSLKYYSTIDNEPFNSVTFYRLRQVDYNGVSTISGYAKVVRMSSETMSIDVHPNPSPSGVIPSITLSGELDGEYSYILSDLTGKQIASGKQIIENSVGHQILQNLMVSNGMYILQVADRYGKTITRKIVIE